MADFARGLHLLVDGILGHIHQETERHLVGSAVVQGKVESIFLDDLAVLPRTPIRSRLRNAGQQLLLEVNFGKMFEMFGDAFRFDRTDLTVVVLE